MKPWRGSLTLFAASMGCFCGGRRSEAGTAGGWDYWLDRMDEEAGAMARVKLCRSYQVELIRIVERLCEGLRVEAS